MLLLITIATAGAADWSGTLPVMYINTIGGMPITSKETYVKATYYVDALGIGGTQSRYHGVGIVAIGTVVRHFTVSAQRIEDERAVGDTLRCRQGYVAYNFGGKFYAVVHFLIGC